MFKTIPQTPELFDFGMIGTSSLGYITPVEFPSSLPFEVKRVYWTYYTPHDVIRGLHAHKELQQIIVAVSGNITFELEGPNNYKKSFILDSPSKGLFIPKLYWRRITFSHNAVLLCLASDVYLDDDYIRSYEEFKDIINRS